MQSELSVKSSNYQHGKIYGRLTLTGRNFFKSCYGQQKRFVEADCICGTVGWYMLSRLLCGDTKSCGCLRKEKSRERMTTHGKSNHPLYFVWQEMRSRCFDEADESFPNYGARGILVCDEWADDFLSFYDWCVANGYEKGMSVDRINNAGHYSPDNCRITTRSVQNRNTRRNKNITAWGETKCLFDWAADKRCVVTKWALRSRYDRGGWDSMEEMISSPQVSKKESQRAMKTNRMLTAFGETKCLNAWLEDPRCTVRVDALRDRLDKGWDDEKAISYPNQIY